MVLICDNKILSIEQFHKHRCEEKNRTREILFELWHTADTEPVEQPPRKERTFTVPIHEGALPNLTPIQTWRYDCKKER